jgi:hypothetical protein
MGKCGDLVKSRIHQILSHPRNTLEVNKVLERNSSGGSGSTRSTDGGGETTTLGWRRRRFVVTGGATVTTSSGGERRTAGAGAAAQRLLDDRGSRWARYRSCSSGGGRGRGGALPLRPTRGASPLIRRSSSGGSEEEAEVLVERRELRMAREGGGGWRPATAGRAGDGQGNTIFLISDTGT